MKVSKSTEKALQAAEEAKIKEEIEILLNRLRKATTTDEKKKLRRSLRHRGHMGGLGLNLTPIKRKNNTAATK